MSGLRAGAKPSRKKASTSATSCGSHAATAPKASSSSTRPASNTMRWRLKVSGGHRPTSSAASGASSASRSSDASVAARRWRLLDRDEVELAAAVGIGAPRRPGGEEVVADAEAGLEHDEALASAPACGQRVAVEEDVARLGERARARVVDVVVARRAWRAVVVADDRSRARSASSSRGGCVAARREPREQPVARDVEAAIGEHRGRHARQRVMQAARRVGVGRPRAPAGRCRCGS